MVTVVYKTTIDTNSRFATGDSGVLERLIRRKYLQHT